MGYTKTFGKTTGQVVETTDLSVECDNLEAEFNNTTGHAHDGTTGEGPVIALIGDAGVVSPLNKVVVDTTNDRISVYVDVASSSVEQIRVEDGVVYPVTDGDVDLGKTDTRFKTAYVDDIVLTNTLPDSAVAASNVTQHQASLSITESQISDLGSYLVTTNNLSDLVSAPTALINLGLTATASEINTALDGTTVTATELDLLSGKTSVATLGDNTFVGNLKIENSAPILYLSETTDANGDWLFVADNNNFALRYPDTGTTILRIESDGAGSINTVNFQSGTLQYNNVEVATLNTNWTTTDITSGAFADARIAESNVTQHQAALSITESQISDLGSSQAISFRAYVTADESAVGSGVVNSTNLSNLSEDFDNGSYFAIATGYFQPSVAGYYHVGMSLYLTTNLAGDNIEGTIRKNAAGTIMAIDNTESDSSSKEGGVSPSTTMYFNGSTDYVYFYHDQATGWTMKAGSQIYGHFVHA